MKISKSQLKKIIQEERAKLSAGSQIRDFGSNAARQQQMNEQAAGAKIPEVEVQDQGGTLSIAPETATEVEAVIAQAFDVIDDLILSIEQGGYPRSTRQTAIDPRLEELKDQLEIAVEGLYNAQMQANHIMAGTGS